MKLSLQTRGVRAALVLSAFALAAFACADSEPMSTPDDSPDGSALPPAVDAGTVDAPVDAAPEADVVVPPRVCSDSNICHLELPVKENLVSVWGDGTGTVWSVTAEGSVLELEAGTWKVHATGLGALVAIWGSGPADIWAAGANGVHHSTGGAFSASTLPSPFPISVTSLWGTAADDVWATGDTVNGDAEPVNVVLHFDGAAWSTVDVPPGNTYYRVWGHAASGVWLAGSHPLPPPDDFVIESVVLRRAPGEVTFADVKLPKDSQFPEDTFLSNLQEVRSASAPNATTMWIHAVSVASYPGVIRGTSADNGLTFTWTYDEKGLTSNPAFNAVFAADPSDGWAVGEWGQVRRWNGTEWKPQAVTVTKLPVIDELNAVWATADRAYIVGDAIAMEWRKP